jgi:hypothetical protein
MSYKMVNLRYGQEGNRIRMSLMMHREFTKFIHLKKYIED